MRQEGFLAHPSRTEVKFSIIEIPYKYLSKLSDIPMMQSFNHYISWKKNYLGSLNHIFKLYLFKVKGSSIRSRVMSSLWLLT